MAKNCLFIMASHSLGMYCATERTMRMDLLLKRLPLNIQLFACGNAGEIDGTTGTGETSGSLYDVLKAFKPEDVLNHPSFKSDLDSRIGSSTSTVLANAKARI